VGRRNQERIRSRTCAPPCVSSMRPLCNQSDHSGRASESMLMAKGGVGNPPGLRVQAVFGFPRYLLPFG
jgi:hypothetical protein